MLPAINAEGLRVTRAGGTTLLISSHVMDEAERCDRLLLMRDGPLIADEAPGALRSRTGSRDLDRPSCTWGSWP